MLRGRYKLYLFVRLRSRIQLCSWLWVDQWYWRVHRPPLGFAFNQRAIWEKFDYSGWRYEFEEIVFIGWTSYCSSSFVKFIDWYLMRLGLKHQLTRLLYLCISSCQQRIFLQYLKILLLKTCYRRWGLSLQTSNCVPSSYCFETQNVW